MQLVANQTMTKLWPLKALAANLAVGCESRSRFTPISPFNQTVFIVTIARFVHAIDQKPIDAFCNRLRLKA